MPWPRTGASSPPGPIRSSGARVGGWSPEVSWSACSPGPVSTRSRRPLPGCGCARCVARYLDAVLVGAAAAQLTFWPELVVAVIEAAHPTPIARPRGSHIIRRSIPSELIIERAGLWFTDPALTAIDRPRSTALTRSTSPCAPAPPPGAGCTRRSGSPRSARATVNADGCSSTPATNRGRRRNAICTGCSGPPESGLEGEPVRVGPATTERVDAGRVAGAPLHPAPHPGGPPGRHRRDLRSAQHPSASDE